MLIWLPAKRPPESRLTTWVRLPNDSIIEASYRPVNHVWSVDGRVVWPVEWQSFTPDPPDPDPIPDSGGTPDEDEDEETQDFASQQCDTDAWLTCTADRFIDYWLAGWESGEIPRPACVL